MDQTATAELPSSYLEKQIFPVLLPGIEATLRVAKKTERRRCFNPLDYLSAYLFRHNPGQSDRSDIAFEDIPYVKAEWTKNPRLPLPLSATLSEHDAAVLIQAFFRGYLVRCDEDVQLFRTWQRKVEEEREAVLKIQHFWREWHASQRAREQRD